MDPLRITLGPKLKEYTGVRCPDCGAGGGSKYPCWCPDCHDETQRVLMLPSINNRIIGSWAEIQKQRECE